MRNASSVFRRSAQCRGAALVFGLLVFLAARPAAALLCATDTVPAATLLFPFLTARYAETATATAPAVDRTSPASLFSITNVSSTAKIVHLVLWSDLGAPVLAWDTLLTGYDVATFHLADILEGRLRPTGPATNPVTGRRYSPTGTWPPAFGPVPSFFPGIPGLPAPGGVGATSNDAASLFGLCTNPTFNPVTLDPGSYAQLLPPHLLSAMWNGLRKSQAASEGGWWSRSPAEAAAPEWLAARRLNQPIHAWVTADVVDACGAGSPNDGADYFETFARPRTAGFYRNDPSSGYRVTLGNVLIGDWFVVDSVGRSAQSGTAVRIEVDNQDVPNSPLHPRQVRPGASFYRYAAPLCRGTGADLPGCADAGERALGAAGSIHALGSSSGPIPDFREPLPSAFAFRWIRGGPFQGGTRLRVWKEMSDVIPEGGRFVVDSTLPYTYWAWDEEEHVLSSSGPCPAEPCAFARERNELPLVTQEVDVDSFDLPTDLQTAGWMLLAFPGSNGELLDVPDGYDEPWPNALGTQAWVDVLYLASDRFAGVAPATVIGNFLCDGARVAASPPNGRDVTDRGDVTH